jgi:probable HAF family extracellular repeat protein
MEYRIGVVVDRDRWLVADLDLARHVPDGYISEAWGVSADGSVVVGMAFNAAGQNRAFRWTQAGEMEDLNQTYASLLAGSRLFGAFAISPDGRYIVGWGFNAATGCREAFLLDTRCTLPGDMNDDGRVDDADLLIVLFNFGRRCN